MIDIKELRRLAEADIAQGDEWPTHEEFAEDNYIETACSYLAAASPSAILSLLDKIDAQEKEIAELHTSIAGAVQHGEQGWQRYEAANKMCLNQQNEIAGLNEAIAELRKDAERYQWLKNRYSDDGLYIAIESGAPGEPPYSINGTYADREIDAAIAQQDKKKD